MYAPDFRHSEYSTAHQLADRNDGEFSHVPNAAMRNMHTCQLYCVHARVRSIRLSGFDRMSLLKWMYSQRACCYASVHRAMACLTAMSTPTQSDTYSADNSTRGKVMWWQLHAYLVLRYERERQSFYSWQKRMAEIFKWSWLKGYARVGVHFARG